MKRYVRYGLGLVCSLGAFGCSSGASSGAASNVASNHQTGGVSSAVAGTTAASGGAGANAATLTAGHASAAGSGVFIPKAGSGGLSGASAAGVGTSGSGGSAGALSAGRGAAAGAAGGGGVGTAGSAGSAAGASGGAGGGSGSGTTSLTGTLGALGAIKPTVNSWVISNSGETLIYMSSAALTCPMLQTMGTPWLSTVAAGAQVIEVVVKGAPMVKTYSVGGVNGGEVNYAPGGMSSSYEKNAASGSITFTKAMANGPVDGTVMATYSNPTGDLTGTFHAEFCANGSNY
jgi:hypothetical protein